MRKFVMLLVLATAIEATLGAKGEAELGPPYRSDWTLRDLAHAQRVPVRKLAVALNKDLEAAEGKTLVQLGLDKETVTKALAGYRAGEERLVTSMILIGMLIVFGSLIVVAFLISLLRHLHLFERRSKTAEGERRSVASIIGTITSTGDLSDYSIAAVVAVIFLHEQEVAADNRLLLTWKRASSNWWRTGGPMPNSSFFATKGWRS